VEGLILRGEAKSAARGDHGCMDESAGLGSGEGAPFDDGLVDDASGEHGAGEHGLGEPGLGEPGAGEHGLGEHGAGEHGAGEHGLGERGSSAVDAALGAASLATGAAASVTRRLARAASPVGRAVLHPPVVDERLHPARAVDALAERGRDARVAGGLDLERVVAAVVPTVVQEVLDTLDLTALVRERVDVDALVASVDIDAIVDRVDIDKIVDRVDIDRIVDRVDIDRIIDRVDVDAIVRRVDIGAIVDRVDIDAIAKRIDLEAIVDRIDIDAIVARVNVEAVVRQVDLIALAEEIVEGIDLPEIIRESTGSMASDVVRDARMQSIDADEAISRLVDRFLLRRRARRTVAPGQPQPPEAGEPAIGPADRPAEDDTVLAPVPEPRPAPGSNPEDPTP